MKKIIVLSVLVLSLFSLANAQSDLAKNQPNGCASIDYFDVPNISQMEEVLPGYVSAGFTLTWTSPGNGNAQKAITIDIAGYPPRTFVRSGTTSVSFDYLVPKGSSFTVTVTTYTNSNPGGNMCEMITKTGNPI